MVLPDSVEEKREFDGKLMKFISLHIPSLSHYQCVYMYIHHILYVYTLQLKAKQHKGSTQGNQPISKQKAELPRARYEPTTSLMAGALTAGVINHQHNVTIHIHVYIVIQVNEKFFELKCEI